jgi:hypothetical protein
MYCLWYLKIDVFDIFRFASASDSLLPTRSECDVGGPVSEPTISFGKSGVP